MDPPGSRVPPPPPSIPDDDDDDDAGGEDEDNRKAVDFGDIDYADINLFYNLPLNTTVSCYYCYNLKLLLFVLLCFIYCSISLFPSTIHMHVHIYIYIYICIYVYIYMLYIGTCNRCDG
jgi:hypothetical protein